ncbi:MAG: YqaA family protein [Rikenellaceae bacterium]
MELLGEWGYWGLFLGSFLASTVMPFSSDALLIASLLAGGDVRLVLVYATVGNFLGGLTSYYIGYLGRWEWIERFLHISPQKLELQSAVIKRYGSLIALMSWVPIIGDVVTVALGFYRVNFITSSIYMFIGRAARFIAWALIFAPQ